MNNDILHCVQKLLPSGFSVDWFVYDLGIVYVTCHDEESQQEVLMKGINAKPVNFVDYCFKIKDTFKPREFVSYVDQLVVETACRVNVQSYSNRDCYYSAIQQNPIYLPRIALNRLMSSDRSGIITSVETARNVSKYIDEVNYGKSKRI